MWVVSCLHPCSLMFVWLLFYRLGNINLWLYFLVLSFPVALLCEAACPLASFQWALQAVIHLWSWKLVHLPLLLPPLKLPVLGLLLFVIPQLCRGQGSLLPPWKGGSVVLPRGMCIWSWAELVPDSISQLTPCPRSPRHVLAARSTTPELVGQDVPGNELWHLTLLPLTGCSPWAFHHPDQPL